MLQAAKAKHYSWPDMLAHVRLRASRINCSPAASLKVRSWNEYCLFPRKLVYDVYVE